MTEASPATLDFLSRAAARLRPEPPGLGEPQGQAAGDHVLDSLDPHPADRLRPAAVLIPVVTRPEGLSVILTERATGLRDHGGQIAFPGGKVDPGDPSPLHAALREAEEEIGLDRQHVRPLGFLDPYLSTSSYLIVPAVAAVSPAARLQLNPREVAAAFEVPLAFLMDEANHALHQREWKGRMRRYYAMPFGDRYIWGVTAGILRNMHQRLYAP